MEFNEELGMKTYDEIVDSTLQGLIDKNVGITAVNDGSVIRSLVEVRGHNKLLCRICL